MVIREIDILSGFICSWLLVRFWCTISHRPSTCLIGCMGQVKADILTMIFEL